MCPSIGVSLRDLGQRGHVDIVGVYPYAVEQFGDLVADLIEAQDGVQPKGVKLRGCGVAIAG